VGTAKRERQKANRQQRLQEIAKEQRQEKTKKRVVLILGVVIGGLLLLFGVARLFGSEDDTSAPPVITLETGTTLPPGDTTATTEAGSTDTTEAAATTTEGPTTTVARTFTFGNGPCPAEDGSSTLPEKPEAPKLCIDPAKTYTATVETNKGEFTMELNTALAPGNVNNFVTLARFGYYTDSTCHRVLTDFVVQCGRPKGDPSVTETKPGYTVADELPAPDSYRDAVVAIANTGQPDSGSGQWFIITGSQGAALPPSYTVLGKVTSGFDTTVKVLAGLADPLAENGTPPLSPIDIVKVTITES
jgi:cyclophilin family peptidyl-prolyl cis-trans isomerase